ncbi:acetylxylan esterase [Emticicia sp. 17c]|uniref:acetylxylan esterase n=1 Tax=Emticicia sp. 17c TaxID=3127704 RepID=UPI00301E5A28
MKKSLLILGLSLCAALTFAQPTERLIKVIVAPEHDDWTYKLGEPVKFAVTVLKYGNPLKNVKIVYQIGPEKFETRKDSTILKEGIIKLDAGTMNTPGFLRCTVIAKVDGKEYRNLATAAFEPEKIQPAVEMPADFVQFWDKAKADLAKVPMDAQMTLLPERCTETVNVYHLSLQNYREGGTVRLYGILCVPKKEGKYPALLRVPGAGVRPYGGDIKTAEKGIITLEIGIHGIPVTMEPYVYTNLGAGPLNAYWTYNLDNRDLYYYKRVYLGCVRANDFLAGLPQFDGKNLAVTGGSQGGALSIVTAGLDPRVKWTAPIYPALADMVGYLKGRAGGWPHIFDKNSPHNNTEAKIKTAAYYDVVNFAKQVKIPCYYSMGFNDETCPPTSMWAVYNVINSPKTLKLYQETGHWTFPEENENVMNWLFDKLLVSK